VYPINDDEPTVGPQPQCSALPEYLLPPVTDLQCEGIDALGEDRIGSGSHNFGGDACYCLAPVSEICPLCLVGRLFLIGDLRGKLSMSSACKGCLVSEPFRFFASTVHRELGGAHIEGGISGARFDIG